jgi:hypothetical protein
VLDHLLPTSFRFCSWWRQLDKLTIHLLHLGISSIRMKCPLRVTDLFSTPECPNRIIVGPIPHWPSHASPITTFRRFPCPARPGVQPFYNSGPYNNNRTMTMSFGRVLPSAPCSVASKLLTRWLITNREEGFSFQPTHILSACINVPQHLTFLSPLILHRWKISPSR